MNPFPNKGEPGLCQSLAFPGILFSPISFFPVSARIFFTALLGSVFFLFSANAQSPAAAQRNQKADELFAGGDYAGAAQVYQELLQNYSSDALVPRATEQLGFSYYYLREYDKALSFFEKAIADPLLPQERVLSIAAFIPKVYAAKAASLPVSDSKRKLSFQIAFDKFTRFLEKHPKTEQAEAVRFSFALAKFQNGDTAAAQLLLEQNKQEFSSSPSIQESDFLLAILHATAATKEFAKGEKANRQKASDSLALAKKLLGEIVEKKSNPVLLDDAKFQLGEILSYEASRATEKDRPALYENALAVYRSVEPAGEMAADLEREIAVLSDRRKQAPSKNASESLEKDLARLREKLSETRSKPDSLPLSWLRQAEIFFQRGETNKPLAILRHALPSLEKPEEQARALSLLTMAYIRQERAAEAIACYDQFQEKSAGNPLGETLPFALGNLFLQHPDPDIRNSDTAMSYFKASLDQYPKGSAAKKTRLAIASVQASQGNLKDAQTTFESTLKTSTQPEELLAAKMGLADIAFRSQQWDKAIGLFQAALKQNPAASHATVARYWIALATQQKGASEAAIPLLKASIAEASSREMLANAWYSLALAQFALGRGDEALASLATIAEKYPETSPAPITYFLRAQQIAKTGNQVEADALISSYLAKYPNDERVFLAYDWLGQSAFRLSRRKESIALYAEFLSRYPNSPSFPSALLRLADFSSQWAESLGRFQALPPEEKTIWEEKMNEATKASKEILTRFPTSQEADSAVKRFLSASIFLASAGFQTRDQLAVAVSEIAANAPAPLSNKLRFALAAASANPSSPDALAGMKAAYQESILFPPSDLDLFASALLEHNETPLAESVYAKLLADYPLPNGTEPNKANATIQTAQSSALFGKAKLAQREKNFSAAGKLFSELKTLYPWFPKMLEVDYGIAQAEFAAGDADAALRRIPAIIRAPAANNELRANAMLLGGKIMESKYLQAASEAAKTDALGAAIDYYLKIQQFYGSVSPAVAEGLWLGAQLLEKQAAESKDPNFQKRQRALALRCYQDIETKYATSPFAAQAKEKAKNLAKP